MSNEKMESTVPKLPDERVARAEAQMTDPGQNSDEDSVLDIYENYREVVDDQVEGISRDPDQSEGVDLAFKEGRALAEEVYGARVIDKPKTYHPTKPSPLSEIREGKPEDQSFEDYLQEIALEEGPRGDAAKKLLEEEGNQ